MFKRNGILRKALAKLTLMQQELAEESQVLGELKENEEADECEFKTLQSELGAKTDALASLTEALKERDSEVGKLTAELKKGPENLKALHDKNAAQLLKLEELNAANQRLLRTLWEKEESCRREVEAAKAEAAAKDALAASLKEELDKHEKESKALSREYIGKVAEYKAALDRERADFRLDYEKQVSGAALAEKGFLNEVEALKNTLRQKGTEAVRADAVIKSFTEKQVALTEDYERRLRSLDLLNASLREEVKKRMAETEALSREVRVQAAEFKLLLEREQAEAKTSQTKDQIEIRKLTEDFKRIPREMDKLSIELKAARGESAALEAQRDAGLIKIAEQEVFSKSALSALKEKERDIKLLRDRLEDISNDLSKKRIPF
ncbi:MAG: hypothetical protein Q7R35_06445 [Elusimicrobiota bacterium]|nr:hypothetical protein [Elusimicrobiota bacterium]